MPAQDAYAAAKKGVIWRKYQEYRAQGLTAAEAYAAATHTNPLVVPEGVHEYGGPGGGHHILQQAAFNGAPNYDVNEAAAIQNDYMANNGIQHTRDRNIPSITAEQSRLQRELA